jgi:hypothetical protein
MIDPLLNSRAAELLAIPAGEPGVFLDREEAELVLEALAEVAEVKKRLGMPLVIPSSPELTEALKDLGDSPGFLTAAAIEELSEERRIDAAIEAERPKVQADAAQLAMRLRQENTRLRGLVAALLPRSYQQYGHAWTPEIPSGVAVTCLECLRVWEAGKTPEHNDGCPVAEAEALPASDNATNRQLPESMQSGLPGPHQDCEHEHRVCVAKKDQPR